MRKFEIAMDLCADGEWRENFQFKTRGGWALYDGIEWSKKRKYCIARRNRKGNIITRKLHSSTMIVIVQKQSYLLGGENG